MAIRNSLTTYGSVAKFLHAVIAILVVLMLIAGYFLDDLPEDWKGFAYNLHKLTGLTILSLMLIRLFWALINPKPLLPIGTPAWEHLAERMVHFMLYLFVILMPLAGWIGSVAGGRPPHIGSFNFELPIAQNKILANAAFEMHGTIAVILITLISIHVLAALYHHFIKRDDILRRMMP